MKLQLNKDIFALVDQKDFYVLNQWKWSFCSNKWGGYAARQQGCKTIYMHRFILNLEPGQQADHINHNGLDNRRSNLRVATQHQNNGNLRKPNHNTSGYKGVSFYKGHKSKPWTAYIQNMGRKIHLGYFETASEAALAYNFAAKKQWGDFAQLNKLKTT